MVPLGRTLDRRRFVKLGGLAVASLALGTVGRVLGDRPPGLPPKPRPPTRVTSEEESDGVLRVAQWYDYWPGSFLQDFKEYFRTTHGKAIEVQWDVYTTNGELVKMLTQGEKPYDVIFPTQNVTDALRRSGSLRPLDRSSLPNLTNLDPRFTGLPFDHDTSGNLYSVPYFWGTVGIGLRNDVLCTEDVEDLGWDLFWTPPGTNCRGSTVLAKGKLSMMREAREAFAAAFKKLGWDEQVQRSFSPTAIPLNPASPYDGVYQWTVNQTDAATIVKAAQSLIDDVGPNLIGSTSSPTQFLRAGRLVGAQVYSGEMVYALRPDQGERPPLDYVLPKQGSTLWMDSACVPANARNPTLAHEFINFIHDPHENLLLTKWNMYSTANRVAYEALMTSYPNGYTMALDPWLYPYVQDPHAMDRLEYTLDLGASVDEIYDEQWTRVLIS